MFSSILWNIQPLGRPLVTLAIAIAVYSPLLRRPWVAACVVASFSGAKLLSELLSLVLTPAKNRPSLSIWSQRLISDARSALILAVWLPCAVPSILILCGEVLWLVRLRFSRPGQMVVLRQNICYHGFMVMPELVVNVLLTLDRLCGYDHVRLKIDFGESTMEGGMHPYHSPSRGPNVWRYFFEDSLSATDDTSAAPAATFGYLLHSVIHHHCATFLFPHEAGASTFALPPSWSGRESDFGQLPYSRQLHDWYGQQRHTFHRVLQRIQLQPAEAIRAQLNKAWNSRFEAGQYVVGVHLRGTDKTHSGGIVYPSAYFPYIDSLLRTRGKGCGLFVATDSPRFLAEVRARYGEERVACLECMRDPDNSAWDLKRDGYSKGREVLLDALCLSRCDFLLFSTSGVPEFAVRLNPALHESSVNLSFDGPSQLDLTTGKRPAASLPDAPVPPLVLLKRVLLAASWWPLFMLKNYSDIPLWLLQRRLLALDVRGAQRDAWSSAEKPAAAAVAVAGEPRRAARRSSRSPRRRAVPSKGT